ncbi:MAG: hypothetical protein H6737_31985 [Alphaproteobacteria bacterium]|nr:hypothetical protein [Alphaproteobacteria bacterium]
MTPFTVATAILVLGGLGGVAWMLWPALQEAREPEPEADEPGDGTDVDARMRVLVERGSAEDDDTVPWDDRRPMLPDEPRRVPWELAPAEKLPVIRDAKGVFLLPISGALLAVGPEAPPVLRGRRQGRAFHAVRLEPGVYLDLVECIRLLPVIGIELDARGIEGREVRLYDDLEAIGANDEQLDALAPWLAGMAGPRVVPDAVDGARSWAFRFGEATLEVKAWIPAVAEGVRSDRLVWAGILTWEGAERIVDSGATPLEVLDRLVDDGASVREQSLEAWRWSRPELTELAAVGHYLDEQGVPVVGLLRDAFADHTVPQPDLHDEAQSLTAAAVLNWVAVVHRRAGYPKRAIGLLDAALKACRPDDDDNRADIHYNRGYCRLQALMARPPEATGVGDLHVAAFDDAPSAEALEPARQDFELASRLNPSDSHAWSQIAIIHLLRGEKPAAEEAWLQAATRTSDPDAQMQLMQNARAAKGEP